MLDVIWITTDEMKCKRPRYFKVIRRVWTCRKSTTFSTTELVPLRTAGTEPNMRRLVGIYREMSSEFVSVAFSYLLVIAGNIFSCLHYVLGDVCRKANCLQVVFALKPFALGQTSVYYVYHLSCELVSGIEGQTVNGQGVCPQGICTWADSCLHHMCLQ